MGRSRSRTPPRRGSVKDPGKEREEGLAHALPTDADPGEMLNDGSGWTGENGSPRRHRSSSLSPQRQKDRRDDDRKEVKEKPPKVHQISAEDMQGKTEEEIEMMKLMGFGSFETTKGKKRDGSVKAFAVNVSQKRKYRQYMNRKGGFNRPLDFIA
ncbi:hypothetical protein DNTS_021502 [Danionella cerebrum]|uniref:U4/U6.U5 small nuclear ribonucleoprotein 27 kDa protein n=1 Tax=Danionella cerebrum TaxID=2873325 RepID=A0A553R3Z5_9TELE|nr:hypothetical protein DNTS_021502 [Danionella translucida]TRY96905.1 hypothetical protein DNTS_021502 [Danionella translucida]TRY96907.1 hypothetical protein DNTS_021502 [Danionella translucida]TRY96908.1 hypothetical protein DNTS_021502 [Danionella translucida]